jgi:hypothetical protein
MYGGHSHRDANRNGNRNCNGNRNGNCNCNRVSRGGRGGAEVRGEQRIDYRRYERIIEIEGDKAACREIAACGFLQIEWGSVACR